MINIEVAFTIIFAFGITMLILSIFMYIKRTGNKTVLTKFWVSKTELNKSELIVNRLGFALAIIGLMAPFFV